MDSLLLPIFNHHWLPHNALWHSVKAIGLQENLTRAGITLAAPETDSPVVSMATVHTCEIIGESLGFPLALLASGYNHHSLLSSISKASIRHGIRIELIVNIIKGIWALSTSQSATPYGSAEFYCRC
ncbi:hypothetical protein [Agrobacterium rosae]|uniref:hypothetical protein n=1 Tax=Agrobacterium rosae TaxID=1972867 RepID=UPI000CD7F556|nr:hypothetical protein [Agrobacterium rosae]POO56264.1 hypothetical protein CTT39_05885 [Agrobacterium rosae]